MEEAERLLLYGRSGEALEIFLDLSGPRCMMGAGSCLLSSDPLRAAGFFSMIGEDSDFFPAALLRRGLAESLAGLEAARETLERALALMPPVPRVYRVGVLSYAASRGRAHYALGTHLQKMMLDGDAIVHLESALLEGDAGVDREIVELDLAYARMREGVFDGRSWFLHEGRFRKIPSPVNPPSKWADPAGKTVMVYAEQGMGDNIHFARYLRPLRERAGRVILVTHDVLRGIFEPLADEVVSGGEPHSPYDLHVPIMSLPHVLGVGDISGWNEPYIRPVPGKVEEWGRRLPSGRKIGVVWSGGLRSGGDEEIRLKLGRRNIEPSRLLSAIPPGFVVVSLQKPPAALPGVFDVMGSVSDYHDTAGIVHHLDAVVGVDTSVIHLAGSMGKPSFMLCRKDACWRWGKSYDLTPWYLGMRICRQERVGDWDGPLEKLAGLLCGL